MKGRTFNTANLPVCLIDFNYTRDTNTAKFDSYFRHFGESVIFVFRQTKSKFAHGEWRSLSANPAMSYTAASVMQCCHGAILSDTMSTVLCYAATMSFNAAGVRDYIATIFDRFRSIVATVPALLKLCYSCQALPLHLLSVIIGIWVAHKKASTFQSNTCVM